MKLIRESASRGLMRYYSVFNILSSLLYWYKSTNTDHEMSFFQEYLVIQMRSTFFCGVSRKIFFLDFKNMVAKGTSTIEFSGGKKQFIQQDIFTTLGEKNR